jgi:hypothetical protein
MRWSVLAKRKSAVNRFYEPDRTENPDSPFVRDASNKLVLRGYWLDMPDRTLVTVMTKGIGANLTNDEKSTPDRPETRTPNRSGMSPRNLAA